MSSQRVRLLARGPVDIDQDAEIIFPCGNGDLKADGEPCSHITDVRIQAFELLKRHSLFHRGDHSGL